MSAIKFLIAAAAIAFVACPTLALRAGTELADAYR